MKRQRKQSGAPAPGGGSGSAGRPGPEPTGLERVTAAPATGRKNGEIAVAAAWAGAGSSAGGDKDRGAIYADMVEDCVALWITRERLEADIAERGVTVFDEKRGLPVENCSVSARVRVSKQMTTIMQTLGYKDQAIKARRPEGDADDEL